MIEIKVAIRWDDWDEVGVEEGLRLCNKGKIIVGEGEGEGAITLATDRVKI